MFRTGTRTKPEILVSFKNWAPTAFQVAFLQELGSNCIPGPISSRTGLQLHSRSHREPGVDRQVIEFQFAELWNAL